jgi:hypothetical protein
MKQNVQQMKIVKVSWAIFSECTVFSHSGEIQNAFCTDSGICAEGPSFECPENMHYRECGSACPRTCADVLEPNSLKACIAMCVPGCFCDEGYALDGETNKCVPEAKCQKGTMLEGLCTIKNSWNAF